MKKMSGFYLAQRKRVKDLTREIQMIQVESQRTKLKKLVEQRKNKWKEIVGVQQQKLPKFSHIKKQYSEFDIVTPNSSGEPFTSEKQKMKLSSTDRVYSSLPNMKFGKLLMKRQSQVDDHIFKNRKFLEFDRMTDQQSAIHRISLQKLQKTLIIPKGQSTANLGKTYFQKFTTHKYNFYDSNSLERSSLLSKSRTERLMNSSLQIQKSRLADSTLDSIRQSQDYSLDCSSLSRSRFKMGKVEEFDTYRSKMEIKSRMKSPAHRKLTPLMLQKNVNSLEC